ncbi:MAG: FAD-dependent thymidylate synthase [Selenomonadaceae bacterium]|nr:FAD-dependent thymidylate synthase [Selenomonadaceae bacterium]
MKIIEPSAKLIDDINAAEIYAKIERCGRVSHQSQPREETVGEIVRNDSAIPFIRKIISLGHESVLEHVSLTFRVICDRAIQNELVRHRHASFTVESTRYVKYDDLIFIKPTFKKHSSEIVFQEIAEHAERAYREMLSDGEPPEQARAVLPLCLKSELYMAANLREWRHILKLRTSKAAHPQMRQIMNQILAVFRDKLPVIVEDIKGGD